MGTSTAYPTPRSRGVQWADASGTALVDPLGRHVPAYVQPDLGRLDTRCRVLFQTLTGAAVSGTGAAWSLDATRGRMAAVLTGAGNIADIEFNPGNVVSPRGNFALRFYVEDYTKLSFISIYLATDTSYNQFALFVYNVAGIPGLQRNGWHEYRFGDNSGSDKSFTGGSFTIAGTAIARWKIRVAPVSGQQAPVKLAYLDYAPDQAKAFFVITADDGYASWVSGGIPVLDAAGFKCTNYIIPALLGTSSGDLAFMTSSDLAALAANGHQVAVHGATALSSLASPAARAADVASNISGLASLGYTDLTDYAWPNGVHEMSTGDRSLRDLLRSLGIKSSRGTTPNKTSSGTALIGAPYATQTFMSHEVLPFSGIDALNMTIIGHDGTSDVGAGGTQLPALLSRIDRVAAERGIGVMMFHKIGSSPVDSLHCPAADFSAIVAQIAGHVTAGNAEVVTMRELRQRIQVVDL